MNILRRRRVVEVELGLKKVTGGLRSMQTQHIVFRHRGGDWQQTGVLFGNRPGDAYEAGIKIAIALRALIKPQSGRDNNRQVQPLARTYLAHVENGARHVTKSP